MYKYRYEFNTTAQLWDCIDCPLYADDWSCCSATGSTQNIWINRDTPRLPDCPLIETDLNIIDAEVPDE